jgi:hypothetical protein
MELTMENCFVIMPIGNQDYNGVKITKDELRKKYDDLIKEALLKARPDLDVNRADDISMPGSITNDIFMRLMHSQYVIADITFPNPNVFYELGIRHAISGRTILLKDKNYQFNIFDISHLRYIEYENTASGLKELAESLNETFCWYEKNPFRTDNQFFELAALLKFQYPRFIDVEEETRKKRDYLMTVMSPFLKNPSLMSIFIDSSISQEDKNKKLMEEMQKNPSFVGEILGNMIEKGLLDTIK